MQESSINSYGISLRVKTLITPKYTRLKPLKLSSVFFGSRPYHIIYTKTYSLYPS